MDDVIHQYICEKQIEMPFKKQNIQTKKNVKIIARRMNPQSLGQD